MHGFTKERNGIEIFWQWVYCFNFVKIAWAILKLRPITSQPIRCQLPNQICTNWPSLLFQYREDQMSSFEVMASNVSANQTKFGTCKETKARFHDTYLLLIYVKMGWVVPKLWPGMCRPIRFQLAYKYSRKDPKKECKRDFIVRSLWFNLVKIRWAVSKLWPIMFAPIIKMDAISQGQGHYKQRSMVRAPKRPTGTYQEE